MTASRPGGSAAETAVAPIVARIEAADSRRKWRARGIFAATWFVLVGGLVALLIAIGAFDLEFLQTWGRFILGGAGLTVFVSVTSIVLAVVFALLGSM
ncbi:MAG: hypothetical protein U9O18_07290, partial [Chloroflexota bacterium]|nr:hypothetical protein [Chloroflexota bacterium]